MPKVDFIFDNLPEKTFTKEKDSNIYKVISSIAHELDFFIDKMEEIRKSKFVDTANGNNLDKIGMLINIKRFKDESDDAFRGRIKTKVPSFIGGGTVQAIKDVVNSFLGVEPMIIEHYQPDEGHAIFDNGILNGCKPSILGGFQAIVKSGTSYISGTRITSVDTTITFSSNSTSYIILQNNGTIIGRDTPATGSEISIATVVTNATTISSLTDTRFILDPFEHYITNTGTITVQIPYNFSESNISLEETKNVIKNTRAAGIAMLIKVIGVYEELLSITDKIDFSFMVGESPIGGSNFIGGNFPDPDTLPTTFVEE